VVVPQQWRPRVGGGALAGADVVRVEPDS
jgi:hypothetical protein